MPRFEHKVFLSATPHNGYSNSFTALLELLDPQRFCRGVTIQSTQQLRSVLVRRLKRDLLSLGDSFPERRVVSIPLEVPDDAPELRPSDLLGQYRRLRENPRGGFCPGAGGTTW